MFSMMLILMSFEPTLAKPISQTNSSAANMSVGGAGRAAVTPAEAASLNPAILAHLRGRDLHSATFSNEWSLGIAENAPDTIVPAAFRFHRRKWRENNQEFIESDLRLALGQFISPQWAFGITGHQREIRLMEASWTSVNFDVGIMGVLSPRLSVAMVAYDALRPSELVPEGLRRPVRTGIGANYLMTEMVRFRLDYLTAGNNDWGRGEWMLGYEASLSQWLVVRMGGQWNVEVGEDRAAIGFGLELPRFRLAYAYKTGITPGLEDIHSVDLGIPF